MKNNTILPKNIFYQQIDEHYFSIIELPPHHKTLSILIYQQVVNKYTKFPYTIFISKYPNVGGFDSGLHILLSKTPITSIENIVDSPHMSHVYPNGSTCLDANHLIKIDKKLKNTNEIINTFFSNWFNYADIKNETIQSQDNPRKHMKLIYESWYDYVLRQAKVKRKLNINRMQM